MATSAPQPGQTISHYRITGKLGAGGMGVVYRAADLQLGRDIALKFLPAEAGADPGARNRLLKEAQAASRLNHPGIATVYEVGESEGTPFIAMELVTGESLRDVLQRSPLPPAQALEVAKQMADALQEAHKAGVLHRDIKPGNVLLDTKGRVKILDFGLAVLTGRERGEGETSDAYLTRTATKWTTGGTVPYMSPEQLRGDATDARSDIFSYGVMIYECLTGRLPFRGETSIDVMQAILRQPPTPLRSFFPDATPEWEQFLDRCLAKMPEMRFQSMAEVPEALARIGSAPQKQTEKSLAVLYFENLSGAKEDEYFRDGMTEDVITELLKIKGLRVFPRSTVLAFRDRPISAVQVGQQLNAAYVLSGSLRRAGDRLRISAQLVDTRDGFPVWAERYDRKLEDVFAIQDELAQNIARELRVMLSEKEKQAIKKAQTGDVQAYDYYLRGRQFFHQFRRKSFDYAREMFARAIVLDPNYARAYAGVADCCSFLYQYWEASEANLKEADAASRKALELDPELAEGHASRGIAASLRKRYDEAQREFDIAIRLNPNLFEAHYFRGRAYFAEGKLEQAAVAYEEASRVNPDDYQAIVLVAPVYGSLGKKVEMMDAYRRGLEAADRHLQLHPDDARALYLGAGCLAVMGKRDQAYDWSKRALEMDPTDSGVLYNVACSFAQIGKSDEAIDCLERAITNGFGHKAWLEHDTDLDSVRRHPRFQGLLQKMDARQNPTS
jgi:serine/threonine protein kinase/Tfp pilus assembly protein PilF